MPKSHPPYPPAYRAEAIRLVDSSGKAVRLCFRRQESAACSEMVVLGDFGKSAHLPEGQEVPVEFLPERPGEHEFTCQMGMIRGKLVVE